MSRAQTTDPTALPVGSREVLRLAIGVAAPLGVISLAFALWKLSVHQVSIDRAAVGWLVVVPLWSTAPAVAGFAWGRLGSRSRMTAAIIVGALITAVAAGLLWLPEANINCQYGPVRTAAEYVLPSLFVGLVIGAGVSAGGLLAAHVASQRQRWLAALAGWGSAPWFL
jgi:hypothetical protein